MRRNTPVFTSYLKLRHTNPDAYHCANTIEQMISLQRQYGTKIVEYLDKAVAKDLLLSQTSRAKGKLSLGPLLLDYLDYYSA